MKKVSRMHELVLSIREEIFPTIMIALLLGGAGIGGFYGLGMDKYERSRNMTAKAKKILLEGRASKMIINGQIIYLASKNTINALSHHSRELSFDSGRQIFQVVNPDAPVSACVVSSSRTSDKNKLVCNSSKGKIIPGLEEGVLNIVFYENPLQKDNP